MSRPTHTCPKCELTYLCCPTCGASRYQQTQANEGETCKCGRGIVFLKTIRICCQRYNHHLGNVCSHCGTKG